MPTRGRPLKPRQLAAVVLLLITSLAISACGQSGNDAASPASADTLATQNAETPATNAQPPATTTWYQPNVDTTWQWQLQGPLNTTYQVDLYDIDLFETSAQTIAELQANGIRVICYFSAGSGEDWRADYPSIPNDALGRALAGFDGERWLDIRSPAVLAVMQSRLDLAASKGCDGVEPDNVDGHDNDTGFSLTANDLLIFNQQLPREAHQRGLAIGLKNALDLIPQLVDDFDFAVNEECHTNDECDANLPFIDAGKPVFNAEYTNTATRAQERLLTICPTSNDLQLQTLVLPLDLDDSFRLACPPS